MSSLTVFGVVVLSLMMVMYALEKKHNIFVFGFAVGCVLSAAYGFVAKVWPFGVVEATWSVVAFRRWWVNRQT